MKIALEPFVPHEESLRFRMADAYYAKAGIAPWTSGAIPYRATSNYASARQHALVAVRLFKELEESGVLGPDQDRVVFEIGGGLGLFAENFFRALEGHCGGEGKALRARLKYVYADVSAASVRAAIARPGLAALVAEGRIVPAVFDLRRPTELCDLEGRPLSLVPSVTIANYVCCVVPPVVVQKRGDAYLEQHVAMYAEAAGEGEEGEALLRAFFDDPVGSTLVKEATFETAWVDIALGERFTGGHAEVIGAMLGSLPQATLVYPRVFVELLDALATRMSKGGLVMISDYGSIDRSDLAGVRESKPELYGNSPSNGVGFALFDAVARLRGWQITRTRNPYGSVHTAALRFLPSMPGSFRGAFHRAFKLREAGEDSTDFREAARAAFEARQHKTAIRYYRRALRLDPHDASLYYRVGEACLEGGFLGSLLEDAYRHLKRGQAIGSAAFDFEFLLGRVCGGLGRDREAVSWYEASLAREVHHVTLANLAGNHLRLGDYRSAYRCLQRSLELAPDSARARELLEETKDAWTRHLAAEG